jgi:hypothetical protein
VVVKSLETITSATAKRGETVRFEVVRGVEIKGKVDGTQVPLRASLEEKGADKQTLSIVLGVVLCPLFLLLKGKQAEIPAETEFTVFVDRPFEVTPE